MFRRSGKYALLGVGILILGAACGPLKLNFKVLMAKVLYGDSGTDTVPRLGPTSYYVSTLTQIFGDGSAEFTNFLNSYFVFSNSKFSASCDPLMDLELHGPCTESREFSDLYADAIPLPSVPRAGQMIRAINGMVFGNPAWLQVAIQRATGLTNLTYLNSNPMPTDPQLVSAWRLFHPGQTPPQAVVDTLRAIAIQAAAQGEVNTGIWAWVFLLLGYDVAWNIP